jgi:hypothetical protein
VQTIYQNREIICQTLTFSSTFFASRKAGISSAAESCCTKNPYHGAEQYVCAFWAQHHSSFHLPDTWHMAAIIGVMIGMCGKFEFGFEVRRLIERLHLSYKRNGILLFSDMWNMNPASISSDKDR